MCEFCDINNPNYDSNNGVDSECDMVLETGHWDYYDGCQDCIKVSINYCPMCGRNLKKERN